MSFIMNFSKMHGLGNDFVVIDRVSQRIELTPEQIASLADRHTGIGFDQLLAVEPPTDPEADFFYRIFNADGTEAEQCGNGARCFALFVHHYGLSRKARLRLQTNTGPIEVECTDDGQVSVTMQVPIFSAPEIPFTSSDIHAPFDESGILQPQQIDVAGEQINLYPVSMGNPHAVLFVDDILNAPVETLGPAIECHPAFPEKVNVGFCQIVDTGFIRLRVFERGVGETRACGSGACAAVAAGIASGQLRGRAKVSLPGGKLKMNWPAQDAPINMTGPATLVFEGQIQL